MATKMELEEKMFRRPSSEELSKSVILQQQAVSELLTTIVHLTGIEAIHLDFKKSTDGKFRADWTFHPFPEGPTRRKENDSGS